LNTDDVIQVMTGAGWGDPMERPLELVKQDLKNGYITLEQAEKLYGVVLNPETLEVEKLVGGRKA